MSKTEEKGRKRRKCSVFTSSFSIKAKSQVRISKIDEEKKKSSFKHMFRDMGIAFSVTFLVTSSVNFHWRWDVGRKGCGRE